MTSLSARLFARLALGALAAAAACLLLVAVAPLVGSSFPGVGLAQASCEDSLNFKEYDPDVIALAGGSAGYTNSTVVKVDNDGLRHGAPNTCGHPYGYAIVSNTINSVARLNGTGGAPYYAGQITYLGSGENGGDSWNGDFSPFDFDISSFYGNSAGYTTNTAQGYHNVYISLTFCASPVTSGGVQVSSLEAEKPLNFMQTGENAGRDCLNVLSDSWIEGDSVYYDTVNPSATTTLSVGAATATNATAITSTWTTSDSGSGVFRWSHARRTNTSPDGNGNCTGTPSTYVVLAFPPPPANGSHLYSGLINGTCYQWATNVTDQAGNSYNQTSGVGGASPTQWVMVDTDKPATNATLSPSVPDGSNGWYVSTVSVSLSASDTASGVASTEYKIDAGSYVLYSGTFGVSLQGTHTITYRSTDRAGNVEPDKTTPPFKIDTVAPDVTIVSLLPNPTTAGATVTWNADENGTYSVRVGGSGCLTGTVVDSGSYSTSPVNTSSTIPSGDLSEGANTVRVCVTDAAGNTGSDTTSVTKDSIGPTVTINQVVGQADPTNTNPIHFTVQFSEPVTDFNDLTDVNLSGTATATVTAITAVDADTYDVAVTATSDGAVIANVPADKASDAAGNLNDASTSSDNTVTYDATPPTTSATPSGTAGSNGWFVASPVSVSLLATDAGSGVAGTTYEIDGGSTSTYSSAFNVSGQGIHHVTFRSTDNAGNVEDEQTLTVKIDSVPPTASSSVATGTLGNNGWYITNVTVSASSSDATSGLASTEYKIDAGSYASYSGAFAVNGDGTHTVLIRATDAAGLVTVSSRTITIDTTPPVTSATPSGSMGNNGWYVSTVSVSLSFSDTVSGVASTTYEIDSGSTTTYAGAFNISAQNTHTVTFRSTDNAGNVEDDQTLTVKIDTTPPPAPDVTGTGTHTHQVGNTVWFNPSLGGTLALTAQNNGASGDKQSGINSHTFGALSSARGWSPTGALPVAGDPSTREYAWSAGASDSHLGITATNNAGLTGPATTMALRGDATPPVVIWSPLPDAVNHTVLNGAESLTWTASDPDSGLDLTSASQSLQRQVGLPVSAGSCVGVTFVNDGAPTTGNSPQTASGLVSGNCYQWVVTVSDLVGNTASATSESVLVDTDPPSGLLSGQGADGGTAITRSQDVTLTCTCNDAAGGSGIEFVRYAIDGGYNWDATNWLPWGSSSAVVTRILNSGSGTYTLLAQIKDYAGNISTITTIITLQNAVSPPALTAAALIVDCAEPADTTKWHLNTTGVIYWSVNAPICLVPTVVQAADGQGMDNRDPLTPYYGNLTAWWSTNPPPADEPWLETYKLGVNPSHNAPVPVGWPDASQLDPNVQRWDAADPTVFRFLVTKETAALSTSVSYILIPYGLDATEQWCTETHGAGTCGAFTGPAGTFVAGDYQHVYPQLSLRLIALNSGQIPR